MLKLLKLFCNLDCFESLLFVESRNVNAGDQVKLIINAFNKDFSVSLFRVEYVIVIPFLRIEQRLLFKVLTTRIVG